MNKVKSLLKYSLISLVFVRVFTYSIMFYCGYKATLADEEIKEFTLQLKVKAIDITQYGTYQLTGRILKVSKIEDVYKDETGYELSKKTNGTSNFNKISYEGKEVILFLDEYDISLITEQYDELLLSTISVIGHFKKPEVATNPGQNAKWISQYSHRSFGCFEFEQIGLVKKASFISTSYCKYSAYISKVKHQLLNRIDLIFLQPTKGILKAMMLGDKDELEFRVSELFRIHGISHILAISGLHISMLFIMVDYSLRLIGIHRIKRFKIMILIFIFYNSMLGLVMSSIRATMMMLIYYYAKTYGYPYAKERGFFYVLGVNIILFPEKILDCGFLLSYGAVFGLFFIFPKFRGVILMSKNRIYQWVMNMFFLNISIMIVTAPVLIYFFGGVSITSVLGNILIVPFMFCFYGAGIICLIFSFICSPIAFFLAGTLDMFTNYFMFWCESLLVVYDRIFYLKKIKGVLLILYYGLIGFNVKNNGGRRFEDKQIKSG